MPVSDLDFHTLDRIFAIVYNDVRASGDWFTIGDYVRLLPIASTCRSWRYHAVRYLYRTAIVQFEASVSDRRDSAYRIPPGLQSMDDWNSSNEELPQRPTRQVQPAPQTEEPAVVAMRTNCGLFAGSRLSKLCTEIIFVSNSYDADFGQFSELLQDHGFDTVSWSHVNTLSIADANSYGRRRRAVPTTANSTCRYLVERLPNIRILRYQNSRSDRPSIPKLVRSLSVAYMKQLQGLYCCVYEALRLDGMVARNVTHLAVGRDLGRGFKDMYSIPAQCANTLKTLHLYYPRGLLWSGFAGKDVWFSSLEQLTLEFLPLPLSLLTGMPQNMWYNCLQISQGDRTWQQQHFPKLKTLAIRSYYTEDDSLYSVFYGSPLQSVTIDVYESSFQHIQAPMVSRISHLCISGFSLGLQEPEVFHAGLSKLLSFPSTVRSVKVEGGGSMPFPAPAAFEWKDIQKLDFRFHINLSAVVCIMEQLPKLELSGDIVHIDVTAFIACGI
ncbi:hypothetical protein GQ54DRAFT_334830 [Martensiomyces pterosporus]|nr:hypothetical protein GQ54DRAFT_334830 [Martensiomyces pterosporus]